MAIEALGCKIDGETDIDDTTTNWNGCAFYKYLLGPLSLPLDGSDGAYYNEPSTFPKLSGGAKMYVLVV